MPETEWHGDIRDRLARIEVKVDLVAAEIVRLTARMDQHIEDDRQIHKDQDEHMIRHVERSIGSEQANKRWGFWILGILASAAAGAGAVTAELLHSIRH